MSDEHFENWLRREAVRFRTPLTWTGNVQPLAMPIMLTPERADRFADLVAAVRTFREGGGGSRMGAMFDALAALDEASRG